MACGGTPIIWNGWVERNFSDAWMNMRQSLGRRILLAQSWRFQCGQIAVCIHLCGLKEENAQGRRGMDWLQGRWFQEIEDRFIEFTAFFIEALSRICLFPKNKSLWKTLNLRCSCKIYVAWLGSEKGIDRIDQLGSRARPLFSRRPSMTLPGRPILQLLLSYTSLALYKQCVEVFVIHCQWG